MVGMVRSPISIWVTSELREERGRGERRGGDEERRKGGEEEEERLREGERGGRRG